MTTATKPKSGFEKWQDGLNKAVDNAEWDVYDCNIQTAVNAFNRHLAGTAGYFPLDWQLIKAMMWVETEAGKDLWKSNPMQIGMPGDPGLRALLSDKEGGHLIVPPSLAVRIERRFRNKHAHLQHSCRYWLFADENGEL